LLEVRYGNHACYVAAVKKATANAVAQKFLLQKDADALIAAAEGSGVLRWPGGGPGVGYFLLCSAADLRPQIGTFGSAVCYNFIPT
jgi:hypothetical protein